MLAVCLSVFMGTLDINIVSVSLPTLVKALGTDFATIQWVIVGYVLVITSMTLGAARLGDLLGRKPLFVLGVGVFTASSLCCGLAPSVGWLIAFRVGQGLGAAMTQALGAALVIEAFPPYERGKAMGLIGTTVSVGLAAGPPLGGVLIGLAGWRAVFLINVPIGIAAVAIAWRRIPDGGRMECAGGAPLLRPAGSGHSHGLPGQFLPGHDPGPAAGVLQPARSGPAAHGGRGPGRLPSGGAPADPSHGGPVPFPQPALRPQPAHGVPGLSGAGGRGASAALLRRAGKGLAAPGGGAPAHDRARLHGPCGPVGGHALGPVRVAGGESRGPAPGPDRLPVPVHPWTATPP